MAWSANATKAKARKRMEHVEPEPPPCFKTVATIRESRPTWRINIVRFDGVSVQITAHQWGSKLLHGSHLETGRQLGRRIGVLLQEGCV